MNKTVSPLSTILSVNQVSFHYASQPVLEHVTLQIKKGIFSAW
ncbi:hypothetical protein [Sinobaca sp. H24]